MAGNKAKAAPKAPKAGAAPQGGQPAQDGNPAWYEPEDVARDQRIQQLLHPQAAATAPGQTYAQAQTTKQDLSKDMAAATGIQNPYAKAPPAQQPAAQPQAAAPQGSVFGPDGKVTGMPQRVTSASAPFGRDASGKPYTDWTGNNQEPGTKGVIEYNESAELSRIITLANLNKN